MWMAQRRPNESLSRSSLDLLAELPNLLSVHGCAFLLVGQLSLQALQDGGRHLDLDRRPDPRVERLERSFDAAIAVERSEAPF
jgi:hypothetical protein